MSTWYGSLVECSCGHRFDVHLVRGANAVRSSALREAALAGTLNVPTCPSCGVARPVDTPLVYADFERGHWIAVARPSSIDQWVELERITLLAFTSALATSALVDVPPMAMRIVFDLDELRERLMIWADGLDDAVVECAKLSCLADDPAIRGPGGRIRVAAIEARELAMKSDRGTWTVDRGVLDRIALDPSWAIRFPALFEPGFVSIDRYLRA